MTRSVSVVIAAWRAEAFIAGAISSALAQSGVEVEVVVVDDASPDGTAARVAAIGDGRVRLIRMAANGGPAAARNAGFDAARGEWLAVLDADDVMAPDRLVRLVLAGEQQAADIIADNVWIRAEGQADRLFLAEALDGALTQIDLETYCLQNLLFDTPTPLGYLKPLFRRSFLDKHRLRYDPALRIGEDYQLVLEALARRARYVRQRSAGYVYTTREGSISHRMDADHVVAMRAAEARLLDAFGKRLTLEEVAAVRTRIQSLDRGEAYVRAMQDLKAGRLLQAGLHMLRAPSALPHFWMPVRDRLARLKARTAAA